MWNNPGIEIFRYRKLPNIGRHYILCVTAQTNEGLIFPFSVQ